MALGEYVTASRDAMTAVNQVVRRRDWKRLDLAVEMYGDCFSRLRDYLDRFGIEGAAPEELQALRQLDIQQRKVMRQLERHMQQNRDDMAVLEGHRLH